MGKKLIISGQRQCAWRKASSSPGVQEERGQDTCVCPPATYTPGAHGGVGRGALLAIALIGRSPCWVSSPWCLSTCSISCCSPRGDHLPLDNQNCPRTAHSGCSCHPLSFRQAFMTQSQTGEARPQTVFLGLPANCSQHSRDGPADVMARQRHLKGTVS